MGNQEGFSRAAAELLDAEAAGAVAIEINKVASLIGSIRTMLLSRLSTENFDGRDEVMVAALEKAGALCDSQSMRLGGSVYVGGPKEWAALDID